MGRLGYLAQRVDVRVGTDRDGDDLDRPGRVVVGPQRFDFRACFTPETVRAVAGAVEEALTNVIRRAGVQHALVRAAVNEQWVRVSILDHGKGFDPSGVSAGVGLRQAIQARLQAVGGSATVESHPGAGTYIELSVPGPGHPVRPVGDVPG